MHSVNNIFKSNRVLNNEKKIELERKKKIFSRNRIVSYVVSEIGVNV